MNKPPPSEQMALRILPVEHSLILHLDCSVQYCHQVYAKDLSGRLA